MAGVGFPGFNSNSYSDYNPKGIEEYAGTFITANVGAQIGLGTTGAMAFTGLPSNAPNSTVVGGVAWYVGGSVGVDVPFGPDIGLGVTNYSLATEVINYGVIENGVYRVRKSELIQDFSSAIESGTGGLLNLIAAYEALYNAGK